MSKLLQHIKQLIEESNWKELEDLLLNTEEEWVVEILSRKVRGSDGPKLVGGLLSALSCNTRESTALRLKIYENTIKQARNEVESERGIGEIIGVLMLHVDAFPTHAVVNLINQYLDYIQEGESLQGRWVSLLPKLIMHLSLKDSITVDGKEMAGEDYRYQIVKTLCDMDWSVETTTSLLPIVRDLDLPKEELQDVIYKVERSLRKVDYQSVPPIIYHLILLGKSKLPGRVLQLIIEYFNKQENKLMKERNDERGDVNSMEIDTDTIEVSKHNELAEAQGTVILHVTHQAQYNPALVRDYLKFIRSSTWLTERLVTSFNLALSLSLASIEKYKDQILESLKSSVLKHFRQEEKGRRSLWLREAWEEKCHVTTAFKTTIDNCIMGWDQVSQGIVHLGFNLLESGGGIKGETYASQKAVALASVVLPLILKKQPHLASAILSRISNCIVSASSPLQYIEILGKLVKLSPLVLMEHSNLIQEQLEYLVFLPHSAASHLLQALLPLFKMSMSLKDALIIILRKMLFSKKIENRQVAVEGFSMFLRHFRAMGALPSSQASMSFSSSLSVLSINADVHSINSNTNEALCLELLGVLRRCFSQQHEVKTVLYRGLYDASRANPKLIVSILELLHQQSKQFLDLRPIILNPVVLKKVVIVQGDSATLIESMGDLLSCLGACKCYLEKYRERENEVEDDDEEITVSLLNEICTMFDVLTDKLAGCGLDDLGIDTKGEFLLSSAAGQKNILSAKAMVSVFDSLMEYSFSQGANTSEDKMQTVLSLFKSQRKIIDLMKEKSVKPNKKDGTKGKGRTPNKPSVSFKSSLRLSVVAEMLSVSLSTDDSNNPTCVGLLKENNDMQLYLLSIVEETVQTVKTMTSSEREKILPHLKTIARVLLQECVNNVGPDDSSEERLVQRIRQSLLVLSSLITIFCKYFSNKLEMIMKEITQQKVSKDIDALLHKVYKKCQRMLLKILQHEDRIPLLKDACVIVQIMSTVSHALNPDCQEIIEAQNWLLQVCKDQEQDHGGVAESMMNLLFFLSDQCKANHTLARAVGRELHHRLGDLEENVNVEEQGKFKIISETSASSILTVLLTHIEDSLGLVELILNKMRASLASEADYDADKIEKYIASKCTVGIHAVHEIIQSALPLGTSTDFTLKVVTKFYNILGLYVRYYLDLFKMKNSPQISEKFEKLVHTSGEMLSGPIYSTITYIEGARKPTGKKNEGALISRTIKESKLIPNLIFAIEQYEKNLIALSRKSKVNLMQGMKLSTSRDFRIVTAVMVEALQNKKDTDYEEEEKDDDDDDNDVTEEPPDNAEDSEEEAKSHGSSDNDKEVSPPSSIKGKGFGKLSSKRKEVGDENDANSQNKVDLPPAKKLKSVKAKLGSKAKK